MEGSTFSIRKAIAFGWTKVIEHLWLLIKIAFAFIVVELVLVLGYIPIGLLSYLTEGSKLAVIPEGLSIAYSIAITLFTMSMCYLGLPRILLDLYEHNTSKVSRVFSVSRLVIPYIGASIIFSTATALPGIMFAYLIEQFNLPLAISLLLYLACCIFGIYFVTRLGYYSIALIDKEMPCSAQGATNATLQYNRFEAMANTVTTCLGCSWKITQGSVMKLIIFTFICILMSLGILALVLLNLFGLVNAFQSHWYSMAFIYGLFFAGSIFFIVLVIPMIMLANIHVYKQLSERFDKSFRAPSDR